MNTEDKLDREQKYFIICPTIITLNESFSLKHKQNSVFCKNYFAGRVFNGDRSGRLFELMLADLQKNPFPGQLDFELLSSDHEEVLLLLHPLPDLVHPQVVLLPTEHLVEGWNRFQNFQLFRIRIRRVDVLNWRWMDNSWRGKNFFHAIWNVTEIEL